MSEERIYKIIHWDDCDEEKRFSSCSLWTLEEVLEEINRDHSDDFSTYDETCWQDGWREECSGWHTMVVNRQFAFSVPEAMPWPIDKDFFAPRVKLWLKQ